MDPITGGLLVGGASLLGSVFSGLNQQQMQSNAQAFNQQMVTQQENFQTQMSNTAYQRASADMKAAGLNPMMMFSSGSSASTPSGSAPSMAPAQGTSVAAGLGPAAQSAINTATALKTADATVNNLVEQNAKLKAETLTETAKPALVGAETYATTARGHLEGMQREATRQRLPIIMDEAISAENRAKMDPTARRLLDQLGFGGRKVSDTLSPISNIVSSAKGVSSIATDAARRASFNERFSGYYP